MTTTEPATALTIVELDPRELVSHPRNVRTNLGDLTGLVASITAQGVLEPLIVVDHGSPVIVAGHRRAAAAIEAGLELVPCIVRSDISTDETAAGTAAEVSAMLAENLHRENLTVVEEARGVQQLLDLGVKLSEVTKRTGLGQKRVKKALGVARLDDESLRLVDEYALDLEQAAAVSLFADDGEAIARLTTAAQNGPGQFAHALTRAKQDRKQAQAVAAKRAELAAAGRTVVDEIASWSGRKNRSLGALDDAEGRALDAESHAACPGSAVFVQVDYAGDIAVVEVCTDFAAYGHVDRFATRRGATAAADSEADQEAARAERRKVLENNKAMVAANATRRAWVREYLTRRSAPPEALRFAVEALTANSGTMADWFEPMATSESLVVIDQLGLGKPSRRGQNRTTLTSGEVVPDGRLPLQLLAHIAGATESQILKDSWRSTGAAREALTRWLRFLAEQGYTLADVEQGIVDGAAK